MKKINILLSGWTLVTPKFNFFKIFLRENKFLNPFAIVYPKKIVENIGYIRVIEPSQILKSITKDTIILQTSANPEIKEELDLFYKKNSLHIIEVEDFILNLIKKDLHNKIKLPFTHIQSNDIIKFNKSNVVKKIVNNFLDFDSIEIANRISKIFKFCSWDNFYYFRDLQTADSDFIKLLIDLHKRNYVFNSIYIADHPKFFIENLIKLRAMNSESNFSIYVPKKISKILGDDLEFYKKIFGTSFHSINNFENVDDKKILILGCDSYKISPLLLASKYSSFLIRANKSIIELNNFPIKVLQERKIILKQPNSNPSDLLICGICLESP